MVVESTLKVFPPHEQFHLRGSDITRIEFNYKGCNLRCCFCFSYRHSPAGCRHPQPSLFDNVELIYDVLPGEQQGKPSKEHIFNNKLRNPSRPHRGDLLADQQHVSELWYSGWYPRTWHQQEGPPTVWSTTKPLLEHTGSHAFFL